MPQDLLTSYKPTTGKVKDLAIEEILPPPVAALLTLKTEFDKEPGEVVVENFDAEPSLRPEPELKIEKSIEQVEVLNLTMKSQVEEASTFTASKAVDKMIQEAIRRNSPVPSQPSIKLKIKDKAIVDDKAQNPLPMPQTTESNFNLVIKKNSDMSTSVVFKSAPQINRSRPSLPKLKISSVSQNRSMSMSSAKNTK